MMQPNERQETDEEFLARLAANRAKRKAAKAAAEEAAKPRLVLPVSQETAGGSACDRRAFGSAPSGRTQCQCWNGSGPGRSCSRLRLM